MKEDQLTKALQEAIPEGVELDISKLNIKGLNEAVNLDTNNVVASKKEGFMNEGKANFLKANDFENEDKFKSFVTTSKGSETENLKTLRKAEKERDDFKGKFEGLTKTVNTDKEIASLTSTDEGGFRAKKEYAAFNHSEISLIVKQAKESGKPIEFKDAAKGYYETNKQYVNPISTGSRINTRGKSTTSTADYVKNRLEERRKKR